MDDKITYRDIVAMRDDLKNNSVKTIDDYQTVVPNSILLQACNHDEWQEKEITALQDKFERVEDTWRTACRRKDEADYELEKLRARLELLRSDVGVAIDFIGVHMPGTAETILTKALQKQDE